VTRNRWLLATVAFVAVVGLGAVWAVSADHGTPAHDTVGVTATGGPRDSGPENTAPTTTPAPASSGPPYAVGVVRVSVVDTSRGVAARGPTPASPERTLQVTIRYPTAVRSGAASAESTDAPALAGPRALVLFAHGFALTDQTYPRFLHDLAASGFVVADPEFPLSSSALPGPATNDVVEQARDLGFVADRVLDPASRPTPLRDVLFDDHLGVVGHSDGGVTAAGFAANSCCADPRVGAVVVLAGALGRFPGSWFTTAAPPMLVLHGDADDVNPLSSSEGVYAAARPPKLFAVVSGGSHIGAFEDDVHRPAVVTLVAGFLRAFLLGDTAAASHLPADADQPGVLVLRASE
jgi:alpha-beta hydrolase superfamily lysophospholipase